uniref:E3 ubiquitin-protein ligase n=2 Tax=Echeneis naucrates TaxID=173247 RepID=A0A665X982_ECHNA
MTASFSEKIAKIKATFDADLKVSDKGQGKLNISIHSRRRDASMESHAARALLRLYQAITTSPLSFPHYNGSMGFDGSLKNHNYQLEGASSGPNKSWSTETPTGGAAAQGDDENCPVCLEKFTNKKQLRCKHEFCEQCLEQSRKSLGPICPVCRHVFGMMEGDQPDGTMSWMPSPISLPGFSGCGSIHITYTIPGGIQTKKHPKPGQPYQGVHRHAYLPDNIKGQEVLKLLKKAFDQKLIFTIGTSRTTGFDNQVTWNDIHHKTSISGGPQSFGYPDPGYLSRVREELKAKGIA